MNNQIDNLISKSLYRPTDGFRFSNATGDNLTLQGKYEKNAELKLQIQSVKDKLVTDLAIIATTLATNVKAKQDLIDGLKVKYDLAESSRADAQIKYDEANARVPKNPGKEAQSAKKEADKAKFSGDVARYKTARDNAKVNIDALNAKIVTLGTDAKTGSDNLKNDAQKKLDDLTKQQNELAKSINDELDKAKKNNDPNVQGLKPVDKVVSPNVSGKTTIDTAIDSVTKSKSKTYMYVGVGLVLLVGGYFLVKKLRK